MTKKDYIKLAELIKKHTAQGRYGVPYLSLMTGFTDGLCNILQDDNPRFDRERFLAACK